MNTTTNGTIAAPATYRQSERMDQNNDKLRAAETARKIAKSGIAFGVGLGLYTLFISRDHITHIGYAIGLGKFEAETLFLLVDFIAVYGKVLTNGRLSAKTRRIGKQGLLAGLGLSLVCNVVSGLIKGGVIPANLASGGIGAAIYGAFIVMMLVWIEHAVSNTRAKAITNSEPRTQRAPKVAQPQQPATTVPAAPRGRKCPAGCQCKKHSKAAPSTQLVVPNLETVQALANGHNHQLHVASRHSR